MKLIIAGSRDLEIDPDLIRLLINGFGLFERLQEIISGTAPGVDRAGELFAIKMNEAFWQKKLMIKSFPADWEAHGKAAGPIRNTEMANYADALLLIWDGSSRGSANMKSEMEKLGKPIYEVILKRPS